MSKVSFFLKRLVRMDFHKMWKTTAFLKQRSGKSRLWLLCDMLRCALRYNAGYMDYKIAEMYRLNDAQKKTVITRGLSNTIVRRMNDKAYWHLFDDKATFNALFQEHIGRNWLKIAPDTDLAAFTAFLSENGDLIAKQKFDFRIAFTLNGEAIEVGCRGVVARLDDQAGLIARYSQPQPYYERKIAEYLKVWNKPG